MQKTLGIVLLAAGLIMLIWTGFSFSHREKLVDAGPIHISADRERTVTWPPYAGGVLAVIGVVLLVSSRSRK